MALCHVGHSSCVPGEHIHRALAPHEGTSQDEETGTQKALVTSIGILSYDRGLPFLTRTIAASPSLLLVVTSYII